MKKRSDSFQAPTVLACLLNFPAALVSRVIWRFGKVNRCELKGESIVFHSGLFTARTIHSSEIKRWSVHPEMGFDVVHIELNSGDAFMWIDKYNDLLSALRAVARPKEGSGGETVSIS